MAPAYTPTCAAGRRLQALAALCAWSFILFTECGLPSEYWYGGIIITGGRVFRVKEASEQQAAEALERQLREYFESL